MGKGVSRIVERALNREVARREVHRMANTGWASARKRTGGGRGSACLDDEGRRRRGGRSAGCIGGADGNGHDVSGGRVSLLRWGRLSIVRLPHIGQVRRSMPVRARKRSRQDGA